MFHRNPFAPCEQTEQNPAVGHATTTSDRQMRRREPAQVGDLIGNLSLLGRAFHTSGRLGQFTVLNDTISITRDQGAIGMRASSRSVRSQVSTEDTPAVRVGEAG